MNARETERRSVIRGTARRVVIVRQDDSGPFEQAIFVVRGESALTEEELLRQVAEAAGAEETPVRLKSGRAGFRRALPWLLTGAFILAIVLLAALLY